VSWVFQYQSLFRRNAEGQTGKIIGLTILAGIMMAASFFAVLMIFMLPMFAVSEGTWAILYAFIAFFLLFLFGVFVIYPLSIGIIKFFTSAYTGESYGFSDLFFVFKEGRYGKAVKLTILVIIAYLVINFAISMLMQLVLTAINLPFSAALGGMSYEGLEASAAMVTGQIGLVMLMVTLNLLVVSLMYIPFILLMIYMILLYLVYVDQPHIPTFDKFTIAFKVMFQAGQSLMKLFFSNVLLLIGVMVLQVIAVISAALIGSLALGAADSGVLFVLMLLAAGFIILAVYIYVMYVIVGSIVAYYFEGRHELDLRAAREMAHVSGRRVGHEDHPDDLEPLDERKQ
jgi:hypothetical protein